MFDSSAAYEDFLRGLSPSFEAAGFKRVKVGFRKRTRFSLLEVKLSKSRDTRLDHLICGLGFGADLRALDPFFRPKNVRSGIASVQFYDFFATYRELMHLPSADTGYWSITSSTGLADAIAQAKCCVQRALQFFEPFDTESEILSHLRANFLVRDVSSIAGQLMYPAYLAATGRNEEFQKAIEDLAYLFADSERFVVAIEKARKKIEFISGLNCDKGLATEGIAHKISGGA